MNDIYKLQQEVIDRRGLPDEWWDKMAHSVPDVTSVDRIKWVLAATKNKVVLDIGCTGILSDAMRRHTKEYHGIDNIDNPGFTNYYKIDLDRAERLPVIKNLQLVVAGEVLEHLSNPGHFLDMVRQYDCNVIVTVPNAHSNAGRTWLKRGIEAINGDHVAYYSYHTLKTLVERHGFKVIDWYWYNGTPRFAEGLIFYLS